jgi:LmbE family N-acetylglucosaminyl deacetylase
LSNCFFRFTCVFKVYPRLFGMNLTYLTWEQLPSRELERVFDDVRVITTSQDFPEEKVPYIEDVMRRSGSRPYDIDDFFLYPPELQRLGDVIARNRLNVGMIGNKGELRIGDSKVQLHCASRLPFNGDSEVLIVAPHDEEDYAVMTAYAHKKMGDSVHVLFVTDSSDREWLRRRESVYRNVLGLEDSEYSFAGIPDTEVHKNKSRFEGALKGRLREMKPKNVILPSRGGNFDHINVLRYSMPIAEESGANILLGKSTQSMGFSPKVLEVFDRENIEEVVSFYSDGNFGNPEYLHQVKNLFALPDGSLNGYVSSLKTRNPDLGVGVVGYQPVKLEHGYQIAHLTDIFD